MTINISIYVECCFGITDMVSSLVGASIDKKQWIGQRVGIRLVWRSFIVLAYIMFLHLT